MLRIFVAAIALSSLAGCAAIDDAFTTEATRQKQREAAAEHESARQAELQGMIFRAKIYCREHGYKDDNPEFVDCVRAIALDLNEKKFNDAVTALGAVKPPPSVYVDNGPAYIPSPPLQIAPTGGWRR